MSIIDSMFPSWAANRAEARLRKAKAETRTALAKRAFDAAGLGRRNDGWRATGADANAENGPALYRLRNRARDLRRNNPYAEAAVGVIADNVIGTGIVPYPKSKSKAKNKLISDSWDRHMGTPACDADGLHNVYGIQHMACESVVTDGEVLVRRIWRKAGDKLPLPFQVQVLEADYLDETKDGQLTNGNYCIQGVEFNPRGKRVAYWLFDVHPGASGRWMGSLQSQRVDAADVIHLFRPIRPGSARGYTWFAPVMQRMRSQDEMDDAVIEQAKIAACLVGLIHTDSDGDGKPAPLIDRMEPGILERLGPNENVTFNNPPTFNGYQSYSDIGMHAIATGLGVPYELLTGNLKGVNFLSGRMGMLRFGRRCDVWQWQMVIPQLCGGLWRWFMEALALVPNGVLDDVCAEWVPPRRSMLDPQKEQQVVKEMIRNGGISWSDASRELGYSNPRELAESIAADFEMFDELGLILDCDPRKVGAAGAGAAPIENQPDEEENPRDGEQNE